MQRRISPEQHARRRIETGVPPRIGVLAPHAGWRARMVAYGAPPVEVPVAAPTSPGANDEPTAPPSRPWAWAHLMRTRVRHRRAGVPAVWRAPARDRHRRGSRRDSRDPRRPCDRATAGGSSSALPRVAGSPPRRDDQRLSAIRTPRTPRPVHSRLEPSCLPVNQLLTPPRFSPSWLRQISS
jgi:hypothetical protein